MLYCWGCHSAIRKNKPTSFQFYSLSGERNCKRKTEKCSQHNKIKAFFDYWFCCCGCFFFLLFEVLIVYITSLSMKNSYRHQCNQKNLFLSKLIEIVHSVIFLYNCLIFLSEFFLFLSSTIISRIRCCTLSTSVLINISVPLIGTHPIEKNKREKREIKKKTADFSTSAPNNQVVEKICQFKWTYIFFIVYFSCCCCCCCGCMYIQNSLKECQVKYAWML